MHTRGYRGLTGRRAVTERIHDRYTPDPAMNETLEPGLSREQVSVTLPHAPNPNKLTYDRESGAGIRALIGVVGGLLCGIILWQLIIVRWSRVRVAGTSNQANLDVPLSK